MIYRSIFLLVLIAFLFQSCGKETDCKAFSGFSGITERDKWGILLKADNNDWSFRDHWGNKELALFDTTYKTNCFPPSSFTISVYPNPTDGVFNVVFQKTVPTKVDLRLVDSKCTTIVYHDHIEKNTIGLQAGDIKNDIVRLYYKFIEDGCEYEGHGDVQIN
ncbi:MAG TPA: hypothetical protein VMZ69_00290 [Saprospiraceae bacterium]|nr:hypothetical protein [Saprospiraceae bacterium]